MINKNWVYNNINSELASALQSKYGLSRLASVVMQGRPQLVGGDFTKLGSGAKNSLHDPFLFKDMKAAVQRIETAVNNNEKITIYGDYDADGVTATALLCLYLKEIGADVDYYIPDRLTEGYGINEDAIDHISSRGTSLIITVDTGISAVEEVYYAADLGIDVIITDHHEYKEEVPECVAVINPKQPDSPYPFNGLSGVGVAFKLVCALCGDVTYALKKYSSLCAIGTIGDMMPVIDENRAIIKFGMKYFENCENYGVTAILNESFRDSNVKECSQISFYIVPRINAAGRVGTAENAIEMFLANDLYTAANYAKMLSESNIVRQKLCTNIFNEAVAEIEINNLANDNIIVVAKKGWHKGVVGIAAAQIVRKYNKPAILFSIEGDEATGSARSIDGYNIYSTICSVEDLLMRFGGHSQAAGLTINVMDIDDFRSRINSASENGIDNASFEPELTIDCELDDFVSLNDVWGLDRLKPFGEGNPVPVFSMHNVTVNKVFTMKDGVHLKLQLVKNGKYFYAIWFGHGSLANELKENMQIDIAGNLEINTFMGRSEVQMYTCDIKYD